MVKSERWDKEDLTLTETTNGLLIKQGGRTYKSSRWRLTNQLIEIVGIGINSGLIAQWQSGHPTDEFFEGGSRFDRGIHHISFAPSHAHKWIFVIGHEGVKKPWGEQYIENLTFNKKYRNFVSTSGVPWQWEIHRGKNIFVSVEHLSEILSKLDPEQIEAVETSGQSYSPWQRNITGVDSEKHLEQILIEYLGEQKSLKIRRIEIRSRYWRPPPDEGRFYEPDLILHTPMETRVVLELKLDKPGEAGLQQIRDYLKLDSLIKAPGGNLKGALVCRDFEPEVIADAAKSKPEISLYRYNYNTLLSLELVSGENVLDNSA